MVNIIDLPDSLKLSNQNFWLFGESSSTGRGLNGREQMMFTENRTWSGRLDFSPAQADRILTHRGVGTFLNGRLNLLRVKVCNIGALRYLGSDVDFYNSIGVSDAAIAAGSLPHSDGARYSDGSGYALPDTGEPVVVGSHTTGATSIRLDGFLGRHIRLYTRFSINDFLYEVMGNVDGQVTFTPPLREAVADGTVAKVSYPTVLVRLEEDRGWKPFTQYGRLNSAMTVNVVEAFDR